MEEARASLNFFGITRKGWSVQFTLRDDDETELMKRFGLLSAWLEEHGVTPKPVGQQVTTPPPARVPEQVQSPEPIPTAPPTVETTPEQLALDKHIGHYDGYFEAESLVGMTSQGKTYWKVKGGKFSKFGVTIWPETLKAAGFDVKGLNPAQTYDLTGFTAYYIINQEKSTPEKEVPEKVVALEK